MGRITETRKLYKETLLEVTKTEENLLSFLDSSSWNFKYDFIRNAYNMVTDNIQDYMSSIKKYIKGTQFEQYTDDELYSLYVPCVWASVSYMMMTRCNINAREKIEGEIDYEENNIHESRRLQYTKSNNGEGEDSRWKIRKNETTLSKNTEESRIHNISDEQRISFTSITNTRTSNENDKTNSRENGETRWSKREIENERLNEMGRSNEQLQDNSRRTDKLFVDEAHRF